MKSKYPRKKIFWNIEWNISKKMLNDILLIFNFVMTVRDYDDFTFVKIPEKWLLVKSF